MLFDDTYNEITSNKTAIYKEKGSKFIGYSFLVKSISDIKKKLEEIKKTHKSANHHCYGYILYADKSTYKFNDDGEPASTAGKQILRQIQKFELTNILIVVVRYFGGIKLGIPGLIRSYKTTARLTLEEVNIIKKGFIISIGIISEPIGKFSKLLCVCAPQNFSFGTFTSTMLSFSILYSVIFFSKII